ncbi:MAG TPA: type II toxin-antitoxin system Phd/YefM family antitoxin [Desulfotomaculum sp.]|nr:type II toxin-antitoxin system Phd/YefM family antitoxin [Desulfotomaculum sp.]
MHVQNMNIVEAKKNFTKLVAGVLRENRGFVITKRGRPAALLLPYRYYEGIQRFSASQKILAVRQHFAGGTTAEEAYRHSREELENGARNSN